MDGSIEAGPEWKDLLDRIRRGETLTVTEHGRPIARLIPAGEARLARTEDERRRFAEAVQGFAARHSLSGISARELIDEGKQ